MVSQVVWNKPDSQYAVPLWIIILAILAGLLLLALLIYVLYKVSGSHFDFCGITHNVCSEPWDALVVTFFKMGVGS